MNKFIYLISVFIFFGCASTLENQSEIQSEKAGYNTGRTILASPSRHLFMQKITPKAICSQAGYLSCLNINKESCIAEMIPLMSECGNKIEQEFLGIDITIKENGRRAGAAYVSCGVALQLSVGPYSINKTMNCIKKIKTISPKEFI